MVVMFGKTLQKRY